MAGLMRWAAVLVLPLAFLLFVQWPLRDGVQAYSRQANDAAQIVFALYVAVALTAASRAKAHLCAHGVQVQSGCALARWRGWALVLCLVPWSLFMLWSAAPQIWAATVGLEKFSETLTPGFFLIRLCMGLLLLLVLLDALAGVWRRMK